MSGRQMTRLRRMAKAQGITETSNSVWRRMKSEFRRDPTALPDVNALSKTDLLSRVNRLTPDQAKHLLARARKTGQPDFADKMEQLLKATGKL